MKKFCFLAAFLFIGMVMIGKAQSEPSADAFIKMAKAEYDLGKLKHNEPTTFYMEFTNISKKPVVVENVIVGCGCTVAEKPAAPVMPGKVGKVKVGYNAATLGKFKKDVTVKIKGAEAKTIYFSGETAD